MNNILIPIISYFDSLVSSYLYKFSEEENNDYG